MADFNRLEMARGGNGGETKVTDTKIPYAKINSSAAPYADGGAVIKRSHGRRRLFVWLCVTVVIILSLGSTFISCFSLWNQKSVKAENSILREGVGQLEIRVNYLQQQIEQATAYGGSRIETNQNHEENEEDGLRKRGHYIWKNGMRNNRRPHHREKRSASTNHPRGRKTQVAGRHRNQKHKSAVFRLDTSDPEITNNLRWYHWIGFNTTTTTSSSNNRRDLTFVRLSDDRKSVTVAEEGLYFVYAQIHFENAKPRNAFAVKVDNQELLKCFQSLDYFNRSMSPRDNSRIKPCYSATAVHLKARQTVFVDNLYQTNRIFNDTYANFWGFIRMD